MGGAITAASFHDSAVIRRPKSQAKVRDERQRAIQLRCLL